jgi:thiamine-phosphate pyrophosphorylase
MVSLPLLYPILDAALLPVEGRESELELLGHSLADAGVTLLQYRNKTGSDQERLKDASLLRRSMPDARLIMNDRADLAVAAEFDGVHVGQQDMSPTEARAIVGSHRIVGLSTHKEAQFRAAIGQPVDYIAFGPIYPTASKQNPDPATGLEALRRVWSLTALPLVAIGGITLENAREVLAHGATSVAAIGAVFAQSDPAKAVRDFFLKFQ